MHLLLLEKAERKVIRVLYNGKVQCKSQITRYVNDYKKIFFFISAHINMSNPREIIEEIERQEE